MIKLPIDFPVNKFSSELRNVLYRLSTQNNEFRSLLQITNCELNDNSFKKLINQIDHSILSSQFDNIEITARINEIQFILNNNDKIKGIQISIDNYFKIYNETKELKYLIRAFELVRKVKSTYANKLENFKYKAIDIFLGLDNSYYQTIFLKSIFFLIQDNDLSIRQLIEYAESKLRLKLKNSDFRDASNYIEIFKTF